MPELPEVETVRRGLEPAMVGARLKKVEQRRPDLRFPFPERFAERLAGQEGLLRIRVGVWRILYEVREREVVVLVVRIGPRGEVYETLG